jgi:hypothetical protein
MTKTDVWIASCALLFSVGCAAAPLIPPASFIPQSREAALLTPSELSQIKGYRTDSNYRSARLFRANLAALRSDLVEVETGGKSQKYVAWERFSVTQNPTTHALTRHGADYWGPGIYFWTGSTSLPARGRPMARFTWGGPNDDDLSGQFILDGVMYTIGTLGRFHVLLVTAFQPGAIPGTEPRFVCIDSTGAWVTDAKPVPRCDRPQRMQADFHDPGPPIPPTLTKAEARPFEQLHPKLRVSPLTCSPEDVTHCEGMVRLSCNAAGDGPVHYYDNASAELLGTCGFWVRNPSCMPQRWRVCAVKNRVRHIGEEPDPSR